MPLKSGKPRKFINKLTLVCFMAEYDPYPSRREFLLGATNLATGLAKAAAFVGLAAVVAACSGDNVENFDGKAGSKDYHYHAWSSIYTLELTNSNGSTYAKFGGKRPDILEKIEFYSGEPEPIKTFEVSGNRLTKHIDNLAKKEYTSGIAFESVQNLFKDLRNYHDAAQKDITRQKILGKDKKAIPQ